MFLDTNTLFEIKKNILLVEDEAIIAMSKQNELGKYGYNSIHALSGEKALNIIESDKKVIDLILMDIDLGKGMDGIQTAQNILDKNDIPIIFLSSHEEKEIVAKTEKITSYGYVVKSSKITVLDASIKMAFKLHDNINLRKEAVEETININKLLRTTIDGVPEPIMLISNQYEILMHNKAAKDKYCFDNDTEQKFCYQITHNRTEPCNGTEHSCPLKCIKETLSSCSSIHKHIQKDGTIHLVQLSAEPLLDHHGNLTGFIETAHDITDQKRLESDLIASEKRFADLFNKAPLGYQSLNLKGEFIEVNQTWLDIMGYTRQEVIGKWFGDFLDKEFVDPFRQRFPIFISRGKIHSEFKMRKKDGSQILISFDGRIVNNLDGSFKQTYCILKDITQNIS